MPDTVKLPQNYVVARTALAQCASVDECRDWSNRAAAIASYAKQAKDKSLQNYADKVKARAIRRSGELLQQIEDRRGPAPGFRSDPVRNSRTAAANGAGMSTRERRTALQVANVPEAHFEALVESDHPASVARLAELGTQHLQGRAPADFQAATGLLGIIRDGYQQLSSIRLTAAVRGLDARERKRCLKQAEKLLSLLQTIVTKLQESANG